MIGRKLRIAIDGPASSGKSSLAKLIAYKFGFSYVDSGAMYRSLALYQQQQLQLQQQQQQQKQEIADDSIDSLVKVAKDAKFKFLLIPGDSSVPKVQVEFNGRDVSNEIRNSQVSKDAAQIARHAQIREELVKQQREYPLSQSTIYPRLYGIVMDGRDIGTNVFPDAELKIYLDASVDVRAKRRWIEMNSSSSSRSNVSKEKRVSLDDIKSDILLRDKMDKERTVGPLKIAQDAHVLNSDNFTPEELLSKVSQIIFAFGKQ